MKTDFIIFLLSIFFILLIFFGIFNKSIEGFSFGSISTPSSSSETNGQYKYLAPLPSDNSWSIDIQNAFVTKFNSTILSLDPSAGQITSPSQGLQGINYMQTASEEEAKSFIDNGVWPRDVYVNNLLTQIKKENKIFENMEKFLNVMSPNRILFKALISSKLPQNTILSSLNPNLGTGVAINGTEYLTCKTGEGSIKQPDGTNIVFPSSGLYPYVLPYKTSTTGSYTLDYSIFEKIPGLTFDGSACNICQTPNFNYMDPSNNCAFNINTPVAFDIYSGTNIKSTPSAVSSDSTSSTSSSTTPSSTSSTDTAPPPATSSSSSWFG
jgi:hypothetical protein